MQFLFLWKSLPSENLIKNGKFFYEQSENKNDRLEPKLNNIENL